MVSTKSNRGKGVEHFVLLQELQIETILRIKKIIESNKNTMIDICPTVIIPLGPRSGNNLTACILGSQPECAYEVRSEGERVSMRG